MFIFPFAHNIEISGGALATSAELTC